MRVALKRTPGEVPWCPPYIYECSHRHHVEADSPVSQCPAFYLGEACRGELQQVGPNGGRIRSAVTA